jgi:hypothetical protein
MHKPHGPIAAIATVLLITQHVHRCLHSCVPAEMYPVPPARETQGLTDKYISTWLKNRKREDIVLATKVRHITFHVLTFQLPE